MDIFWQIANEKIKRAYEDGEFDHLPGKGKPLKADELAYVPEELRMAFRIMKNAGYSVEEDRLKQEMMTINQLLAQCTDEGERQQLTEQFSEKLLKYQRLLSKRRIPTNSSVFKNYQEKIERKLL
ncbi:DUF1992 domain-containing protein [Fervidibacillus albus]|uniref:DUF1992 domain-containing protein n=1 Tax=Fervidibacillus albus TaxID=2980026 RepID=A0A9E8RV27_9BACI|nr:DUF1992 domain-containing protein [Fervidibacillus albus]WAA09001.1 DUF1992 domain-containing protein [Fervidibacillus albus]